MAGKKSMSCEINSEMALKGLHRVSQFTYSVSILLLVTAFIINAIHGSYNEGSTTECTLDCHIFHSCLDSMGRHKKTNWNNQVWIPILLVFVLGSLQFFRGRLLAKQKDWPLVDGGTVFCQWVVLFLTFFYALNSLSRGANVETSTENQQAVSIPSTSEFAGFQVLSTWTEPDSTGKSSEEQPAFSVLMAFLVVAIVTQCLLRVGCFFKDYYRSGNTNRSRAPKVNKPESVLNYIFRNAPEIGYVVTSLIIIVLTWVYYDGVKDFKNLEWGATIFKHAKTDVSTTAEYYTAYVVNGTEESCNMTDVGGTVDYSADEIFNRTNCSLGVFSNSPTCPANDQDENESKSFKTLALVGSIFELIHISSYIVVTVFGLCGVPSFMKKVAQFVITGSVIVSLIVFLLSLFKIQKKVLSESCQSSCYLNPQDDNKKCDYNIRILVAISSLLLTRMAYEILNFDSQLGANRPSDLQINPFKEEEDLQAIKMKVMRKQTEDAITKLAA